MPVRLLVVEDEPALLSLLDRFLRRAGYEVEGYLSSAEALEAYRARPGEYRVVITDLTLDGLNGEEMLESMRQINSRQAAIIASGYAYEPRLPGVGFLQKPFLPAMLIEIVERAIAESAG